MPSLNSPASAGPTPRKSATGSPSLMQKIQRPIFALVLASMALGLVLQILHSINVR